MVRSQFSSSMNTCRAAHNTLDVCVNRDMYCDSRQTMEKKYKYRENLLYRHLNPRFVHQALPHQRNQACTNSEGVAQQSSDHSLLD